MKGLLWGLLALFVLQPARAQLTQPEHFISLDHFDKCGLITRFSPNKIDKECFQYLNNAILDQDFSILRRQGYAQYNTACAGAKPVRGLWPFFATDGSQYLIFQSSASMFYSKGDGTCTAITGLTGLSQTAAMTCVQAMGYEWCSNGIDPVFRTNVTSTDTITQAPLGPFIGTFRNRILLGGVSGNLTNIYLSGEINGLDWTLPVVTYSTSPAIIRINGTNDGLGVSCMMAEFQNQFLIGREYDLYALSGYDLRDFTVRKMSDQIGCMEQNSVQEVNNVKYWLSHRGVEGLTGTQIGWASYPIDPTIREIITAAGNTQSQTINSNNFTTGNLTASGPGAPISATILNGNLVVSTWAVTENSSTQWNSGTFSSSVVNSGVMQISTGAPFTNAGFNASQNINWTFTNISTGDFGVHWLFGGGVAYGAFGSVGIFGGTPAMWTLEVHNASGGGILFSSSTDMKTSGYLPGIYVNTSNNAAPLIYLTVYSAAYSTYSMTSSNFPNWKNGFTYAYARDCQTGAAAKCRATFDIDELSSGVSYSSATFLSQIFDTGLSTPTWGPLSSTATFATNGSTVTFQTQVSTSATGIFDSLVGATDTIKIASAQKRFIRYKITFNQSISTQVATVSSVKLSANTTGYYITPCITAAGNTAWGVLSVDAVNNGGSFSFWMSTSAVSCAQVIDPKNANWTAVTPNSIPIVTVSSYTAVRVLFSVDAGTQNPILNDLAINWTAGASRPPVASAVYLNRYYMFYTTSSAVGAANDHAVIFDQNQHWLLYDDVNAASAAYYLNSLYIGDSQATGKAYLFDTGQADNGNQYNFTFTTPDMDGGDPISPKEFTAAYMMIGAPSATTQNSGLTCTYTINGSSTTYALGTVNLSEAPEGSGYFVAKLPFPSGQPVTGQWINLSCNNYGSSGPIRVYGIRISYNPTAWP